MKTIVFFNNKGGVGKTSLVYHLAWMFSDLGLSVVAADLDPQANLTSMFLDDDSIEGLWPDGTHPKTILGTIEPILRGTGDISEPYVADLSDSLGLICGDLGLSTFEDKLSDAWPRCHDGDEAAFRSISAFYRILLKAAAQRNSELVLIDVGPNLGAINRAAILSAEHVGIPLAPDLFSLQGLKNLGPRLHEWRSQWEERLKKKPRDLPLPSAAMVPAGYVLMQHSVRLDRPTKAYDRWASRVPGVYRESVLNKPSKEKVPTAKDPFLLYMLKHFRSLMPMAMDARKPIFHLLPADGAIGSHFEAVQRCRKDFRALAETIASRCGVALP